MTQEPQKNTNSESGVPKGSKSPEELENLEAREANDQELTFTNAPNLLTALRIALVPVVVGLLFLKNPTWDIVSALFFAAASITDYFDGYLARQRKQVTVYGKLMDPLADKFLVVSSLIVLQDLGLIHPVVNILLICRELAVTGLRALASAEGVVIAASDSAKLKTATQMVAIPLIMVRKALFGLPLYPIGMGLLYFSLAISLWSAKDYVVGFYRGFKESRMQRNRERELARAAIRASRAARFSARINRALALKQREGDKPEG